MGLAMGQKSLVVPLMVPAVVNNGGKLSKRFRPKKVLRSGSTIQTTTIKWRSHVISWYNIGFWYRITYSSTLSCFVLYVAKSSRFPS